MGLATRTPLSLSQMTMRPSFKVIPTSVLLILLLGPYFDSAMVHAQSPQQMVTSAVEAAHHAGVPDTVLSRILTLSIDHHLSSTDVVTLLDIFRAVGSKNFPPQPFVTKIEEGLAKKVAVPTIVAALEQKIDDYQFARTLLSGTADQGADQPVADPHLTAMVDSLSSGISREQLTDFIHQAPTAEPSMMAIAVENLALLNQIGFPQDLTLQMLYTGLRFKRFSPPWRYLARVIVVARNRGIPDPNIAEATLRAMEEKSDLRGLMTALGFTGRDLRHGPAVGRSINGSP